MTPNAFLAALRQHRLVDFNQLQEVERLAFTDSKALAKGLIQRGWLTPYQANQLLTGKGEELVLGSYILMDRLGEGGMGQVFKARHRNLGRIAAIKLIRKERLDNANAVKRFQREVRSAAALSHPNIVLAYDADEIGGTHLLVMEYVEGATDLARLVKQNGPLTVAKACDYIRQAALGLQHAHERGMVHRDIKPANLLLTGNGTAVKVLDMGLARLDNADADDKSSTMTQEGSVMGTPDYIAPEQAMDSHSVDIRADLYSLGCAFYFLLTGSAPFPGGTMMEKLMKHRLNDPRPVETLRPDVPPGVGAVVRKLMAKNPKDRYQTPAELVRALAPVSASSQSPQSDQTVEFERGRDSFALAADDMGKQSDTLALKPQKKPKDRRWLLVGAVASCTFVGLVALLLAFKGPAEKKLSVKGKERPVVPISPPKKAVTPVEDDWMKQVAAMPPEKQVEAVAAKLKELNPGFDGKMTQQVEGGAVTEVYFFTDYVTDISPVRALTGLRALRCNGSANFKGKLADLSPLQDLPLTTLYCHGNKLLSDLSPLKNMKLTSLDCHDSNISNLSPLKDMKLTVLYCSNSKISDLSPLQGMNLTLLRCNGTKVSNLSSLKDMKLTDLHVSGDVSDLSPLKDMKLTVLYCLNSKISDLSPLQGMNLTVLHCGGTKVSDLSPLQGMNLTVLHCGDTKVSDLSPLKDMKLTQFRCQSTKVSDLSPLRGMPLNDIQCDFKPFRDTEILRSIKTLETINTKPAQDFWKEVDEKQAAFAAWCKEVAAMPAEKQVKAVAAKLKELNPGFDGKMTHKVEGGLVTEVDFLTDNVTDISPVRALTSLRTLKCRGSGRHKGKLADLSPLKGLPLTALWCTFTQVEDLTPLKGMNLTDLHCDVTKVSNLSSLKDMKLTVLYFSGDVSDLSPLKDMKLTVLYCVASKVSDLSPLKNMDLTVLSCSSTQISDLSPVKDMKLTVLLCGHTKISDLSPVKEMPLKSIECNFKPFRDIEILRSIKTLGTINTKPAQDFWKEVDEKQAAFAAWSKQVAAMPPEKQVEAVVSKLKELNRGFDGKITHKVEGGTVSELDFVTDNVTDISPVRALTGLRTLKCRGSAHLKGKLADLSPLRGMPLTRLLFEDTQVSDLSPLEECKELTSVNAKRTQVTAAGVAALQKALPKCKIEWDDRPK